MVPISHVKGILLVLLNFSLYFDEGNWSNLENKVKKS